MDRYPNGLSRSDLIYVGEIAPVESIIWKATVISEIDYQNEEEDFDTEEEAQTAVDDSIELLDLKINQLMLERERLGVQLIRKVVD